MVKMLKLHIPGFTILFELSRLRFKVEVTEENDGHTWLEVIRLITKI